MAEIDTIIKRHFGTTQIACAALGVSKGAISQWRKSGIPPLRRYHVQDVIRQLKAATK